MDKFLLMKIYLFLFVFLSPVFSTLGKCSDLHLKFDLGSKNAAQTYTYVDANSKYTPEIGYG